MASSSAHPHSEPLQPLLHVVPPRGQGDAVGQHPQAVYAYVAAVTGAGLAASVLLGGLETGDLKGLIALTVLAVAANVFGVSLYGNSRMSTAAASGFAISFLYGPAGAVTAIPLASIVTDLIRPPAAPWYSRLFNMANAALSFLAVAAIFRATLGAHPPVDGWLIPVSLAAAIANYVINVSLLAGVLSLTTGQSMLAVWKEKFRWQFPHYLVLAFLGLALALAYEALGLAGILAFVAPPVMMHIATSQYITRTTETVSELKRRNLDLARANREITKVNNRLRETYDETLEALASALDARDRETKGHSVRVTHYMMDVARQLGVPPGTPEWTAMQRGALMHDVGKIGVPDEILHKPGALDESDWQWMRRHPRIGADILRGVSFLEDPAVIVLSHHERYDGRGYPQGLQGEEIPLGARIFAIADAFDAMTSDRPYRKAMSPEKAAEEVVRNSGSQFDPEVVQAFLMVYPRWVRELSVRQKQEREAA